MPVRSRDKMPILISETLKNFKTIINTVKFERNSSNLNKLWIRCNENKDLMILNNCVFAFDHLNGNLPNALKSYFHRKNEHHNHKQQEEPKKCY